MRAFDLLCVHRPSVCPSRYLLLNHQVEFNQTCYMTSHGKGVREQYYLFCPFMQPSSVHLWSTARKPENIFHSPLFFQAKGQYFFIVRHFYEFQLSSTAPGTFPSAIIVNISAYAFQTNICSACDIDRLLDQHPKQVYFWIYCLSFCQSPSFHNVTLKLVLQTCCPYLVITSARM